MSEESSTLSHMEKIMEEKNKDETKENIANSYGAVMLNTGEIVSIKRHFFILKELWKTYIENPEHEVFKLGHLFETEEVLLHLRDIKMIIKTQSYDNFMEASSVESQTKDIIKTNLISNHILSTFPSKYLQFNNDMISEEELSDFDDEEDDEGGEEMY